MFQRATAGKHNFMTVDLNARDPLLRFRKNFDEMLLPNHILSEEEIHELREETNPRKKKKEC
jgi:hypothetical protein